MKNKNLIITLIIFILALSVRIYWIEQKQGFHVDEMFTRTIITGNKLLGDYLLNSGTDFTSGKILKNFYFDNPKNSLPKDLIELRKDNYTDDAHPSLYYSLMRIGFSFSENNPQGFIHLGCRLNLIFFIFSFFIMQKILVKLFGDNKLVPIGLAVAFLNTGTISMTLFIRPYEMQMLAFVLISYVYLIFKDKLKSYNLNTKDILNLTLTLTFTFLSGYFLILYVAILGIILLFHARKNLKNIILLCLSVTLSLLLSWLFYNGYFQMLQGQRFSEITENENAVKISSRIIDIISYFCNLTKFLFYPLICLFLIIFSPFMKKKLNADKSVIICAFLWTFIVIMFSPFPVLRYIAPAFPVLSVLITYYIGKVDGIKQNILIYGIFIMYILSSIFPVKNESPDTMILYKEHSLYIPYLGRLENLYLSKSPDIDKSLPVIILSSKKSWYSPLYLISNLNDEQKYKISLTETNKYNLQTSANKHFYIFADKNIISFKINENVFNSKFLGNYSKFKCYEIFVND